MFLVTRLPTCILFRPGHPTYFGHYLDLALHIHVCMLEFFVLDSTVYTALECVVAYWDNTRLPACT